MVYVCLCAGSFCRTIKYSQTFAMECIKRHLQNVSHTAPLHKKYLQRGIKEWNFHMVHNFTLKM